MKSIYNVTKDDFVGQGDMNYERSEEPMMLLSLNYLQRNTTDKYEIYEHTDFLHYEE